MRLLKYAVFACVVPGLLALGLWLMGVQLDWSSWKTYAGLLAITAAMALS